MSDSPCTGSTHSPSHTTVPGDADELNVIEAVPRTDSPGPSAGTSDASPTISSEVVTTESADANVLTLVAGAAASPRLRTATTYSKLPPGATSTLSGDTLAIRSGEPVTVTLNAEQLLSVSDSPSTGSTHSPTHMTVPGDAAELNVIEAALLADSPGPSAGTSDASPTISSEIVTTESADANVLTLVAGAAASPWLRTATAYSKLPPGATSTLPADTLATRSGGPVRLAGGSAGGGSVLESPQAARLDAATTTAQRGHLFRRTGDARPKAHPPPKSLPRTVPDRDRCRRTQVAERRHD